MYSLGVILFEMCHPLPTNMERDRTLRAIREKHHSLPSTFEHSDKALQGHIIESLLSHTPNERPSAADLLRSGSIPLQVEEETFRRAIVHLLSDPSSPDYKKILSAIFSQSPKRFEDIAWDMESRGSPAANELLVQSLVKEKLTSIFRRHGAVETARQLLFPRSQHYTNGAVRLLDSSGNLLQLPFDLTLPNARAISRQHPSLEKTFAFGTVYRETTHGVEPRTHKEVDFDIVSPNTLDLALKEAEVIKVLDEVIEDFPPLKSTSMSFLVNHSDLLQLIMEFCRITPSQIPLLKEIVSKLNVGKWTMQKIRSELRSPAIGVASTSLDDLARFDFRGMHYAQIHLTLLTPLRLAQADTEKIAGHHGRYGVCRAIGTDIRTTEFPHDILAGDWGETEDLHQPSEQSERQVLPRQYSLPMCLRWSKTRCFRGRWSIRPLGPGVQSRSPDQSISNPCSRVQSQLGQAELGDERPPQSHGQGVA